MSLFVKTSTTAACATGKLGLLGEKVDFEHFSIFSNCRLCDWPVRPLRPSLQAVRSAGVAYYDNVI